MDEDLLRLFVGQLGTRSMLEFGSLFSGGHGADNGQFVRGLWDSIAGADLLE